MTLLAFLGEWAVRSSALILCAAALLRVFRVKDAAVRLTAWTVVLGGSLAMPAVKVGLPEVPVRVWRAKAAGGQGVEMHSDAAGVRIPGQPLPRSPKREYGRGSDESRMDWSAVGAVFYAAVAAGLLVRVLVGLVIGRRMARKSVTTGMRTDGIEVRESARVASPVTLGIWRPVIVVPADWREWSVSKLEAVVAHERSHVRRRDPALQALSAVHRAAMWHSPLAWWLHRNLVRSAEEASDDAVVAATGDRASYAEVLLEFVQRGVHRTEMQGVAMARYGNPEKRIDRILDNHAPSRGVGQWAAMAMIAIGAPLVYLASAATPQAFPAPPAPPAPPSAPAFAPMPPAPPAMGAEVPPIPPAPPSGPMPPAPPSPQESRTSRSYVIVTPDGNTSGSWNSSDRIEMEALKAKYGNHFAWLRQDGHEYVITDSATLALLDKAMEPQKAVNRQQAEVNAQQSTVNGHQGEVNKSQAEVNALQSQANRRQEIINGLQSARIDEEFLRKLKAAMAEMEARKNAPSADQSTVNKRQAEVNAQQAKINEEQGRVNQQQSKVNEQQRAVSAEFSRKMEEIFAGAVKNGTAKQVK